MLKDGLLKRITASKVNLQIRPSRCLRMRFYKNSCTGCAEACPPEAILIKDEAIEINDDNCTGCLICAGACVYGCISVNGLDFNALLHDLKAVPYPVLGCAVTADTSNASAPCLGFLSEEYLLSLFALSDRRIIINLSQCRGCNGEVIIDRVNTNIIEASKKLGIDLAERITLALIKEEVDYTPPEVSRRGFFSVLKKMTLQGASEMLKQDSIETEKDPYGAKSLPQTRTLLNKSLLAFPGPIREKMLANYYYTFWGSSDCASCQSCIGMCPTGALMVQDSDMLFNPSLCTGCNLCSEFCIHRAARITKGYYGRDPLIYAMASVSNADLHNTNVYSS